MHRTSPVLGPSNAFRQHPRFAAFYEWYMKLGPLRRMADPLRQALISQASGIVLEIGAGNGLNFQFYEPTRCERVEAIEPDQTMLRYARQRLTLARVPITLTTASVEALPFADQMFESVVVTLVLCSVADPLRGLLEIRRVLKPGGILFMIEHVRAQGAGAARIQDAVVPLTTRFAGNCHWNRDTAQLLKEAGFRITQQQNLGRGLQPIIIVQAVVAE